MKKSILERGSLFLLPFVLATPVYFCDHGHCHKERHTHTETLGWAGVGNGTLMANTLSTATSNNVVSLSGLMSATSSVSGTITFT